MFAADFQYFYTNPEAKILCNKKQLHELLHKYENYRWQWPGMTVKGNIHDIKWKNCGAGVYQVYLSQRKYGNE